MKPTAIDLETAIALATRKHDAAEIKRRQQQGLGRPVISTEINGTRIVVVGNRFLSSDRWKTFADFLYAYLISVFGKEWASEKLADPESHPLGAWLLKTKEFTEECAQNSPSEIYTMKPIGAFKSLIFLAYNLYQCEHNWRLPVSLIKRLKDPCNFWGATYEAYVLGIFARCGFDIEFEEESKGERSYCEFIARSRHSRKSYAVEAKSTSPESGRDQSDNLKIHRKISAALKKHSDHPRMIFIDINVAYRGPAYHQPSWTEKAVSEIEQAEKKADARTPSAYLFITNRPYQIELDSISYRTETVCTGFLIDDFPPQRNATSFRQVVENRNRHREPVNLLSAMEYSSEIPSTFDDRLPEEVFAPDDVPRLLVGHRYMVPDGDGEETEATLESATVVEHEKTAYSIMKTKSGKRILVKDKLTENEIEIYKKSPSTFFGIVDQRTLCASTPYETFDSIFSIYGHQNKKKLLRILASASDFDELKKMPRKTLAKELCFRIAEQVWHSSSRSRHRID